eukprot:TRINITY_DN4514_c0_g1_i1.p1 TRINITY_DN4514_c0_g1~~TRINITY_DN4514_c0_g1_i1.p1  ORF type:complete len:382 (+),score=103.42 TRINITY_DN4514_c0_g1_i1:380-1525(+)
MKLPATKGRTRSHSCPQTQQRTATRLSLVRASSCSLLVFGFNTRASSDDSNRVVLKRPSDYINASRVTAAEVYKRHDVGNEDEDEDEVEEEEEEEEACQTQQRAPADYLVTQGPLAHTVEDFWWMAWENRSRAIVMLCSCDEKGVNKSVRYWPTVTEPVLNCGPFVVRLVRSYSFEADTVCTELSITNGQESTEPRTIMHYQFTGWADHCVLASSLPIRRLIRKVSEDAGDAGGPPLRFPRNTVVHCSAGIGRSGTFCAIHVALQKLHRLLAEEEEGTQSADNTQLALLATEMLRAVNVCAIVKELRRQRCGMVQGLEQYTFCHYAVQDELTELGILRAPYCCFLGTARCASGTTAHPPCSMHHEHEEDTNSKTDSPPEER